jgi:hypothetical protein
MESEGFAFKFLWTPTDSIARRICLYSTRSLKPLGTLNYHKAGCQALFFARSHGRSINAGDGSEDVKEEDDDDEMTASEKEERARWLISGGKDDRICTWALMSFEKQDQK